jgi:fructokinase
MRLGLDIGGTKMEAAILNTNHEVLARHRVPTEREKGFDDVMIRMHGLINETIKLAQLKLADLQGIGVGLPGTVDPQTRKMLNGNTNIFVDVDLVLDLQKRLNKKIAVAVANDANCFALAEATRGAGLKYQQETGIASKETMVIGIILGTGVGGGIIINGKIHEGRRGQAGEVGHTSLNLKGPKCYCGRNGCAELYLSGHGLEERYKLATGSTLQSKDIFERPELQNWRDEYQDLLVAFLGDLSNTLDPDFFVLGGGVSKRPEIYLELEERLNREIFINRAHMPIRVYQHQLGDSAGVIGAAMLLN